MPSAGCRSKHEPKIIRDLLIVPAVEHFPILDHLVRAHLLGLQIVELWKLEHKAGISDKP